VTASKAVQIKLKISVFQHKTPANAGLLSDLMWSIIAKKNFHMLDNCPAKIFAIYFKNTS